MEIHQIRDELQRTHEGPAWHGPDLRQLLSGLTSTEASTRLFPDAHSIWEIVLHLTAWSREVCRRMRGGTSLEPEEGDWPQAPEASAGNWEKSVDDLEAAHREVFECLQEFRGDRLPVVVESPREREAGITFSTMLHGLALHGAYHAGQIALLRKMLEVDAKAT